MPIQADDIQDTYEEWSEGESPAHFRRSRALYYPDEKEIHIPTKKQGRFIFEEQSSHDTTFPEDSISTVTVGPIFHDTESTEFGVKTQELLQEYEIVLFVTFVSRSGQADFVHYVLSEYGY